MFVFSLEVACRWDGRIISFSQIPIFDSLFLACFLVQLQPTVFVILGFEKAFLSIYLFLYICMIYIYYIKYTNLLRLWALYIE